MFTYCYRMVNVISYVLAQCFSTFLSMRNPFDQQKLLRNPFANQKKFAEPLKFEGLSSLLSSGIRCFKAFLHKLAYGIGIMSTENVEKKKVEMLKQRFFSNLAEPFDDPRGTLGLLGTPVEKHCSGPK